MPRAHCLLLGRDYQVHDRYDLERISDRTVAAISLGSAIHVGDNGPKTKNEDALLVMEDDRRVVLAVADAHFGEEASHDVLATLLAEFKELPGTPDELADYFTVLSKKKRLKYESETTLLVVVFDKLFKQGFGLSWGDSTFFVVQPGEVPIAQNRRGPGFVSPSRPKTIRPKLASSFTFNAAPGDLLLAFTDGINECDYRNPDTSITPYVLTGTLDRAGYDPEPAARALVELALRGVNDNPGGEDNIALVAHGVR